MIDFDYYHNLLKPSKKKKRIKISFDSNIIDKYINLPSKVFSSNDYLQFSLEQLLHVYGKSSESNPDSDLENYAEIENDVPEINTNYLNEELYWEIANCLPKNVNEKISGTLIKAAQLIAYDYYNYLLDESSDDDFETKTEQAQESIKTLNLLIGLNNNSSVLKSIHIVHESNGKIHNLKFPDSIFLLFVNHLNKELGRRAKNAYNEIKFEYEHFIKTYKRGHTHKNRIHTEYAFCLNELLKHYGINRQSLRSRFIASVFKLLKIYNCKNVGPKEEDKVRRLIERRK